VLRDDPVDCFVRWRCSCTAPRETRVVPGTRRRSDPFRLSATTSVFNDTAHAVPAIIIGEIAYDPDARMVHFHNGGDSFSRAQPEDRHLRRVRNRIAIECDDLK